MSKEPENLSLETVPPDLPLVTQPATPSPILILQKAIDSGITAENVAVVKELVAMCREQRAEDAKAAFAKAFFQLRKNMPEIYADKQAKNDSGNSTFSYCSEQEISEKLEPHLMAHGFAMLFGQSESEGRITVEVTLMHEGGHSEKREFTVRSGQPNRMKDAAMCDTGGATTAWRHLMMKWFGLKSRISDQQEAKIEGERISPEKVMCLKEMLAELPGDPARNLSHLLAIAGVKSIEEVTEGSYGVLFRSLAARKAAR